MPNVIVNDEFGFVFIKTNKTAGTSLEIGLSRFCGPTDVITKIRSEDEAVRRALGYRGPQNHMAPFWEYRAKDIGRLVLRGERRERFSEHMSANAVRALIGESKWATYFTFCFERNPFDRVISQYYWWRGKGANATIDEFLDRGAGTDSLKRKGSGLYRDGNQILVDHVYRYEDLSDALVDIRTRLGLPDALSLPLTKATHRTDRRPYQEVLTLAQQDRIRTLFADELQLFGYDA